MQYETCQNKESPALCLPEAVAVYRTLLWLCTTEAEQIVVYEELGMWEEGKISLIVCVKISYKISVSFGFVLDH